MRCLQWTAKWRRAPPLVYLLTAVAGIGGFLFGYDTGVISGALLFIKEDFGLTTLEQELVVSLAIVGAIAGSLCAGPLSSWAGRRLSIMLACVVFALGGLVMGLAPGLAVLLLGRFLAGLGVGVASMTVPVYIAECAPEELRGALVSVDVLLITTGQFASYCTDAVLAHATHNWRLMLGLSAVPALAQLLGMLLLPPSPRWLASRARYAEAAAALARLRPPGPSLEADVEAELAAYGREGGGGGGGLLAAVTRMAGTPNVWHMLAVGGGLQLFQQLCGINTVMYYSPTILQLSSETADSQAASYVEDSSAAFASNLQAIYASMLVALTNMLMSFVAILAIDHAGRRPLLLLSLAGVFFSLLLLGVSFLQAVALPLLSLLGLMLYLVFFAPGMGPVPWAVNSEIYPQNVRSTCTSIATCLNWTANLVVSLTFLTLIEWITAAGTFWLFACISLVAFASVALFVPETKGLPLEKVQEVFGRGWLVLRRRKPEMEGLVARR